MKLLIKGDYGGNQPFSLYNQPKTEKSYEGEPPPVSTSHLHRMFVST